MKGKICIVTGANSGIGLETTRALAEKGATVVLVCRNPEKGKVALEDVKRTTGNQDLHLFQVDLESQDQIRKFADAFKQKFSHLDVLVNNAGAFIPSWQETVDGIESTFATNHLAYFLLTHLLLDELQKADKARVINVSSGAHQGGERDFDNLQLKTGYSGYKAYANSKLGNILFTTALAERLSDSSITVNALHPGVVSTNIGNRGRSLFGMFFNLLKPFFMSAQKGAKTSIYLATSPEVDGVTGKYFERSKEVTPSRAARDMELARRLFEVSASMTGVVLADDRSLS